MRAQDRSKWRQLVETAILTVMMGALLDGDNIANCAVKVNWRITRLCMLFHCTTFIYEITYYEEGVYE